MQVGRGQLSELECAQESAQKEAREWGKVCSNNYGNSKKLIHPVCEKGQGHKMLLIIESCLQPSNVLLVGDTLNTERQKAKE